MQTSVIWPKLSRKVEEERMGFGLGAPQPSTANWVADLALALGDPALIPPGLPGSNGRDRPTEAKRKKC